MIITILHETSFEYKRPIRGTFTEARLWPVSDESQTCREFSLSVDPLRPLTESQDYFGNMVLNFNILPPHRYVVMTGHSIVETHRNPFAPQKPLTPWEMERASYDYLGFDGPVENGMDVLRLARETGVLGCVNGSPEEAMSAMQRLNTAIFDEFTYAPEVTDVHTKISEVFETRQGVCQDFAHIFIAACRAGGIPARYVSGYLVTRRSRSAAGSPASHAWVEALVPGWGWRAFDPTNNLLANDYYIKLAVGRDYRDVPPTRGIHSGSGADGILRVRVHTIVHEDSFAAQSEGPQRDGQVEESHHSQAARELIG
jgi:transglutaminase-like putative cysteine protease